MEWHDHSTHHQNATYFEADTDVEEISSSSDKFARMEPSPSLSYMSENIGKTPSNDSADYLNDPRNQNHVFKCRQLPCRTFISTGSCPYGDRCVFLHDPSIVSKPVYIRTKVSIT